jgi:hypothetical protein
MEPTDLEISSDYNSDNNAHDEWMNRIVYLQLWT